MPSKELVLGFDTSAAHCAAALLCDGVILEKVSEDMGRGQAERLMPLLQGLLARHGRDWSDLTAIGVGIGPGNFTGIRISVATARGLALSLGIAARGVDSFEAISLDVSDALPTVPAPRGQLYLRKPGKPAQVITTDEATAQGLPLAAMPAPDHLAANIARITATGGGTTPPAPLYVRPADAAPSKTPPPVILRDDA